MIVVGVPISTREQRNWYELLQCSYIGKTRLDCTRRDVKFSPDLTVRIGPLKVIQGHRKASGSHRVPVVDP